MEIARFAGPGTSSLLEAGVGSLWHSVSLCLGEKNPIEQLTAATAGSSCSGLKFGIKQSERSLRKSATNLRRVRGRGQERLEIVRVGQGF
jgi:hypothetical protein